jgi:hypothetical protein
VRFTPLKKKGRHGEEMEVIRRKVFPRVLSRPPARACEGCNTVQRTLQWSHVFGRRGTGGGLGDWADIADLTTKLCVATDGEVGCHAKLDRHLDDILAMRLTWAAINRLAKTCKVDLPRMGITPAEFPATDAVRSLIRILEADGWTVDSETLLPVKAA